MAQKKQKKVLSASTIDAEDVGRFEKIGAKWWDESGPMKPLHEMNPVRLQYIRDQICGHFDISPNTFKALKDLKIIDVGCGGGILSEPLSRMGADVTGIDAGKENIKIAKAHAEKQGLGITYKNITAEGLAATKTKFDVVTALEIIEHVADVDMFLESCCKLVNKNGMIILSTLNRTAKSYLLGIVAAEYILRLLPPGTHDWKKFLRPSEIVRRLEKHGFQAVNICGLAYNPLTQRFALHKSDMGVNYFLTAVKK